MKKRSRFRLKTLLFVVPILLIFTFASTASAVTYYPPFTKFREMFWGQEDQYHWITCHPSDSSVNYAKMYIGWSAFTSIQVVVGKNMYLTDGYRKVSVDFRIKGYLYQYYAFRGEIYIRAVIERFEQYWWFGWHWDWFFYDGWEAYSYEVEDPAGYGAHKSWNYDSFHFQGPYTWMPEASYRVSIDVYIESCYGGFCWNGRSKSSPGKVYFDEIGIETLT